MSKKYFLFLLVSLLILMLNACGETTFQETTTTNILNTEDITTEEETTLTDILTTIGIENHNPKLEGISDYNVDVVDATTLGIKTVTTSSDELSIDSKSDTYRKALNRNSVLNDDDFNEEITNFLVKTVDGSNTYYNVDFSVGDTVISQEELEVDVRKLLVLGDFTFIQFADVTSEIYRAEDYPLRYVYHEKTFGINEFDRIEYISNYNFMSFVISNTTGKIYQIPYEMEDIKIQEIRNNIIRSEDGLLYNFYINDNDELIFESLFTNKDIEVINFAKDRHGICYVLTRNFSYTDEENQVVYIKDDLYEELFLSDKGNVWVRQASGNEMLCFESFNQLRQINENDDDILLRLDHLESHHFVFINNLNAHYLCADSSGISIDELSYLLHFSLRGYGCFYYFDFFNDNKIVFNDYTNKQLVIFDFSSFLENLTYGIHYEISTTDDLYQFFDEEDIDIFLTNFDYTEEQITILDDIGITFEAIGLDGTDTYLVYLNDGIPTKELYSVYDAPDKNIVTLQPIN